MDPEASVFQINRLHKWYEIISFKQVFIYRISSQCSNNWKKSSLDF